jgi:hypothetical protein
VGPAQQLAPSDGAAANEPPAAYGEAAANEPLKRLRRDRLTSRLARLVRDNDTTYLLQVVQPALVGMIDGTVSTLAPIFAAAVSSNSRTALLVGIATALGAGVSMGFSEALSDTGQRSGRGSSLARGLITGGATTIGGVFHSLPFIISNVHTALIVAGSVVAVELVLIAWIRFKFLNVSLRSSLLSVTLAGAIVAGIGVIIGSS